MGAHFRRVRHASSVAADLAAFRGGGPRSGDGPAHAVGRHRPGSRGLAPVGGTVGPIRRTAADGIAHHGIRGLRRGVRAGVRAGGQSDRDPAGGLLGGEQRHHRREAQALPVPGRRPAAAPDRVRLHGRLPVPSVDGGAAHSRPAGPRTGQRREPSAFAGRRAGGIRDRLHHRQAAPVGARRDGDSLGGLPAAGPVGRVGAALRGGQGLERGGRALGRLVRELLPGAAGSNGRLLALPRRTRGASVAAASAQVAPGSSAPPAGDVPARRADHPRSLAAHGDHAVLDRRERRRAAPAAGTPAGRRAGARLSVHLHGNGDNRALVRRRGGPSGASRRHNRRAAARGGGAGGREPAAVVASRARP